jgi:cyclase
MYNIRVIPRLDIKGPNLVKGIHLEGLRVLGKPEDFARYYYENGADELFFQDVVASLYDRNSLHDIISKTAKNILIPLTVGGGIRTLEDIRLVLRAGADKVSLNTAAIKERDFIKKAANKFGSSTIVVAIEAIKSTNGKYYAFIDNGREETGLEVVSWAKEAQELGAGEILITSVDRDGTGEGFDLDLVKEISNAVNIPVIAHGGCSSAQNVCDAITYGSASAISVASALHYLAISKIIKNTNNAEEGNTSFIDSGRNYNIIKTCRIQDIKESLIQNKLKCRPVNSN